MKYRHVTIAAACLTLSACAVSADRSINQTGTLETCPAEAGKTLAMLVGDWTLNIEADEGWTGYGASSINRDRSLLCGVQETTDAVFDQESDTPMETRSVTVISWDTLSEAMKVMSSDDRGFVHLGQHRGAVTGDMAFEILRLEEDAPTRRMVYRDITEDSFKWVWQGRAEVGDPWEGRLIIDYTRQ